MTKSKLIRILSTFSKEEIKDFEKFIRSPYYGIRNFVIKFYKEIRKYHPEFREKDIKKEKIFSKLYKGKQYNDGVMRRMISDLIRISEEYLMINSFKATDLFRDTCLLHELRVRRLDDIFENKCEKLILESADQNTDINTLLKKFFIENQMIGFYLKVNEKKILETSVSASNAMIGYFLSALNNKSQIISVRKNSAIAKQNSQIYDKFIEYFDYHGFINSLEERDSRESFFVKVDYYFSMISLNKYDTESYFKLRQLLCSDLNYFTGVSKYNYFTSLAVFCTNQINNNKSEFLNDYFRFINIILNEKLFLANSSILDLPLILNIIIFSLQGRRFKYAEDFIKDYSKYFNPKFKKDIINYYQSLLMFSKGSFNKSLEYSSGIRVNQSGFKKELRILKLKCFYELGYSDSLASEIDSFRRYISGEALLSKISKLNAANFSNYFSRLLKLNEKFSKKESIPLLKEIENEGNVNEKRWLIEKIKKLK